MCSNKKIRFSKMMFLMSFLGFVWQEDFEYSLQKHRLLLADPRSTTAYIYDREHVLFVPGKIIAYIYNTTFKYNTIYINNTVCIYNRFVPGITYT